MPGKSLLKDKAKHHLPKSQATVYCFGVLFHVKMLFELIYAPFGFLGHGFPSSLVVSKNVYWISVKTHYYNPRLVRLRTTWPYTPRFGRQKAYCGSQGCCEESKAQPYRVCWVFVGRKIYWVPQFQFSRENTKPSREDNHVKSFTLHVNSRHRGWIYPKHLESWD